MIMRTPSKPHKEYAKYMKNAIMVPKTAETKENTEFEKYREEKRKTGIDPSKELFKRPDYH